MWWNIFYHLSKVYPSIYLSFNKSFNLSVYLEVNWMNCGLSLGGKWEHNPRYSVARQRKSAEARYRYQRQNRHHWVPPETQTEVLAPLVVSAWVKRTLWHGTSHAVNCARWVLNSGEAGSHYFCLMTVWTLNGGSDSHSKIQVGLDSDVRRLFERSKDQGSCYGCSVNVSITCNVLCCQRILQ